MNWNIQTELPLWLIPAGLGLAVLLSWLSYYNQKARQLFPEWARITLIALRSITFLFIFFLFLGPKIISRVQSKVQPVMLLGLDNSASMAIADSAGNEGPDYMAMVEGLRSELEKNFDVYSYLFSNELEEGDQPDFSGQASDFSILFDGLARKYNASPVKGMFVFSDGIFNQGENPVYASGIFPFTVHTIGLGDTARIPDLRIREVTANEIVYKDTRFPVEVIFDSWNLPAKDVRMRVASGNSVLLDTLCSFFEGENTGIARFLLDAEKSGVQNYRISLEVDPDEENTSNNYYNLTVEVVESRARIIILYASPHPDVSAVRSAIGEMEQYELETADVSSFDGDLKDYQLAIFHQLPAKGIPGSARLMQEYVREQVPALFIVGEQSDMILLNQLDRGIRIENPAGAVEDISGAMNKQFTLFKVDDFLETEMMDWPPLKGPLSPVTLTSRSEILMFQEIKGIRLDYPLLCFTRTRGGKNGFLLGEGIWRWRLSEYLESGSADQVNGLIKSIVQYLVLGENRDRFRLDIPKSITETEQLIINAQVYNESYEDVSGLDIDFKLIDSANQVMSYQMRPSYSGYSLVLDPLGPGIYNYTAETSLGSDSFKKQGQIHVLDVKLEEMFTTADFRLLKELARQKDGRFFEQDEFTDLLSFAGSIEQGQESLLTESRWINLLQIKHLIFLIVFLLTLEWLLRRWFGTR